MRRKGRTYLWAIPLVVFAVAISGSMVTTSGMDWYRTLSVPAWTPSGSVIGAVWTGIYLLSIVAAIEWWSRKERDVLFRAVAALFALNAFLNVGWSVVFFGLNALAGAVIVAALLAATTWLLVGLAWKRRAVVSALLVPYAVWATFAGYLTSVVAAQNGVPSFAIPNGVWLFVHLAGFVIGLGSVTVIDLLGFLGRRSCYWTETTIRAHKVTKPLIWVGIALASIGGALWYGAWTPTATAQAIIAVVLMGNGCYLSCAISPFLLRRESLSCARELLPGWIQRRIAVSLVVSDVGWWLALALTVAALV